MVDLRTVKTIVFDLGGVLVNLNINKTIEAFESLGVKDVRNLISAGLHDGIFRKLEIGELSEEAFYDGIRNLSGKHIPDSTIKEAWCAMLLDLPLKRVRIIEHLKKNHQVYLLSNTNVIHQRHFDGHAEGYRSLSALFDKVFYSHLMHDHKPNQSIFKSLLKQEGLVPAETVFLDDAIENIKSAQSLGMQVIHVTPDRQMEDIFKTDL